MKKFFRVFYSQIFNSFFPILIIAILIKLTDSSKTASIFLLLNFANIYLLFSDYSSNTIFLKDALQLGGISQNNVPQKIVEHVEAYIGLKIIVLAVGFFVWIGLCVFIPQLNRNSLSNILAYTFIIGNNLNFYWLYMSSNKEYFFVISNFLGRLFLLSTIILYVVFKINFFSLMPIAGLGIILISVLTFKRFCKIYNIKMGVLRRIIESAATVMRRDWPLVANSFLIMTPTTCLSLFIGFIKNSNLVLVYAFAEKIFMAIRALLAVFVNSVYPVICQEGSINTRKSKKVLLRFYAAVATGCVVTYLLSPWIFKYLHQPSVFNLLFTKCLLYFLITIMVISLNTRYFLHLLVTNHFNDSKNFKWLLTAAIAVVVSFAINIYLNNDVIAVVRSVLESEAIIVLTFVALTNFTRPKIAQ